MHRSAARVSKKALAAEALEPGEHQRAALHLCFKLFHNDIASLGHVALRKCVRAARTWVWAFDIGWRQSLQLEGNLRALGSVGVSEACSGHTHPFWYMLTATYCTTCTKITPQSRDSSLLSQLPENRQSVRQVKTARPSSLPHLRRLGPLRRNMKLSVTANVRAIRRKTRALPVQDS